MDVTVRDVRSMLDELFRVRTSLAALSQERDAAILRQLPPELQEIIAGIMQEFVDMQEQREYEDTRLAEKIRTAVQTLGIPVQGTHLQATYRPGNRSWDSDGLEDLATRVPEVLAFRRQGEPIVGIRTRTQHRRQSPLLYDIHSR